MSTFELCLNYKMENFTIAPPSTFSCLQAATKDRFDLTLVKFFYANEEGIEIPLTNEKDYALLLSNVLKSNLKELEIVIRSTEEITQKRKKSLRKNSKITMSPLAEKLDDIIAINEDEEEEPNTHGNDMGCDYDYFGDTRNKRCADGGKVNKFSNNLKEKRRIRMIQEEKDQTRKHNDKWIHEYIHRNDPKDVNEEEEEQKNEQESRKQQRKRKLKKNQVESNSDSDEEDEEETIELHNIKGNKIPKKVYRQTFNGKKGRSKLPSGNRK